MLKTFSRLIRNMTTRQPQVRVNLIDLELERRADSAFGGLFDSVDADPDGIEFRFEAFNVDGEIVSSGKIDHIPGMQVTVRYIKTEPIHQRQGYGTAVVRWLSAHFGSLPIVPADERGECGVAFWAALRERPATGLLVKEQIGATEASLLIQRATRTAASNEPQETQ